MATGRPADAAPPRGAAARLKRIGLLIAMAVLAMNVWTGGPLAALWIGSQVQGTGPPSMGAIAAVGLSLALISLVLIQALGLVSAAYDRSTGRPRTVRTHLPWLRSLGGGRPHETGGKGEIAAIDAVMIACVVLAVAAFEIWFFFFAGKPFAG